MRIDLDANATTPVLPEVLDAMRPFFAERHGNPSSAHQAGQRARAAVEHARASIATLLHCTEKEIVFTSGGTESNNLALTGLLQPWLDRQRSGGSGGPVHLITTSIEHHAVLFAAESLERRGVEVTYVGPDCSGVVRSEDVEAALRPHTRLISIMLANNETGAIQPVGRIARVARAQNVLMHTDAVQAAAKLPLDLAGEFKNVDLLSLSGHKMYAPQGTGVLFVRKGVELAPLLHGGPQERQRRAGTENVAGIVGLGRAAELAHEWLASDAPAALAALRDQLQRELLAAIPEAHINAEAAPRTPNTVNIRFDRIDAEALLIALDLAGIATSFGAACMSGATEPSHVLLAMGLEPAQARSSLRLSLSRLTTAEEIDGALDIIPQTVERLRALR